MPLRYFLAVDAGGTKADYLLADDMRVLARVRTGSIKRMRVDAETATAHLEEGLREIEAQSGISLQQVTRICVGTAGETVPLVTDWLRREVTARVSGDLLLLGDVAIALDAAFSGDGGVLVLAGTGSNVTGRTHSGFRANAGGWGPALADQGSGHRIGQQALRALFLAHDEGRPTTLTQVVLNRWSLHSMEDLVAAANTLPAPDFSRLTPLVLECAQQGDAVAAEVLHREGEELAYLVRLVIQRLQANDPAFVPRLAFAGSVMEYATPVREALIASLRREFANTEVIPGVVDPVMGALWRARLDL